MSKFNNNFLGFVGNVLLIVIFLTIVGFSFLIVWEAFFNFRNTNRHIERIMTEISFYLQDSTAFKNGNLKPEAQAYLTQLELKTKATLDSNTISFLFQIFAIALVSAGIYLLSNAHAVLRRTKKKADLATRNARKTVYKARILEPIVQGNEKAITIASYFSLAFQISWLIKRRKEGRENLLVEIRDLLTQIHFLLNEANKLGIGFEKDLFDNFLDRSNFILENLEGLPIDVKEASSDILDSCNQCINILKGSKFVKRYNAQIAKLSVN